MSQGAHQPSRNQVEPHRRVDASVSPRVFAPLRKAPLSECEKSRIPPEFAVPEVAGFIKGKSATHLARVYGERKRGIVGRHLWARECLVSTVGRDGVVIHAYI